MKFLRVLRWEDEGSGVPDKRGGLEKDGLV